jgi:antitoxin HicB
MEDQGKSVKLKGYSVRISRLAEEDGGGWLAEIPELEGCKSDGETPDEALFNIQDALEGWLEAAEEDNKPIPSPECYQHEEYSGKFTLRLPKSLHRFLSKQAEREGVSLNQFILTLISFNSAAKFMQSIGDMNKSIIPNSNLFLHEVSTTKYVTKGNASSSNGTNKGR